MSIATVPASHKAYTADEVNALFDEGVRILQAAKMRAPTRHTAKVILHAICQEMSPRPDGQTYARLSMRDICVLTGLQYGKTVQRYVHRLVDLGIIEVALGEFRKPFGSVFYLVNTLPPAKCHRLKSSLYSSTSSPFPRNSFRYQTKAACGRTEEDPGESPIRELSDHRHNAWRGHTIAHAMYLATVQDASLFEPSSEGWGGTVLFKKLAAAVGSNLHSAYRELRYLVSITGWTTKRVGRGRYDLLIDTCAGQSLNEQHVKALHHQGKDHYGELLARVKVEREIHRRWLAEGGLTKAQRQIMQDPLRKALNAFWWRHIRGEITMAQFRHAWSQTIAGVLVVIP